MEKRCLGFFTNPKRADLCAAVRDAAQRAQAMGFACSVTGELQACTNLLTFSRMPPDILLCLGGDGTILRAVADALLYDAPICGVNLGRIGFLSEAAFDELDALLAALYEGRYTLCTRMMLQCSLNGGAPRACLNDVLIYKRSYSGVIGIHVTVDGDYTGVVYGDGVVVSTPTGATGYSISAGGPVIAPGMEAALITPICPHSLTYRPILTAPQAQIEIRTDEGANLALDGNHAAAIGKKDSIRITRAAENVRFVQVQPRNFFALIRERLT